MIIEGRDIASKIMPNADLKFFFKCSLDEKAKRRLKEFKKLNNKIKLKDVKKALKIRDFNDKNRKESPLLFTKGAVLVDTTKLNLSQMRLKLIKIVKKEINKKNMEVYKDLSSQAVKEFENLLNSQMSKVKIEEGKIINGTVTKISEKFVFLFVEGLKSEPVLDINEIKTLNLFDKLKVGSKLPVLLEKIEDKNGEVIVSATKAQKLKDGKNLKKRLKKTNL